MVGQAVRPVQWLLTAIIDTHQEKHVNLEYIG